MGFNSGFKGLNICALCVGNVRFMSQSIGLSCSAWRCFTRNWSDKLHEECVEAANMFSVGVWVILKFRLIGLKISHFKYAAFCDTNCVQCLEETSFSTLIILRFFFYFTVDRLRKTSIRQLWKILILLFETSNSANSKYL